MRTAFYTVALSAALLLTGSWGRGRAGRVVHLGAGLHLRCPVPVRGRQARRRARSRLFAIPCQRTLRGLFDNPIESHLDRAAMRGGHSSILSHRHIRRRLQLHEAAPRRGQRHLQVSAGVHGLSRRRSVLRQDKQESASRSCQRPIWLAQSRWREKSQSPKSSGALPLDAASAARQARIPREQQ